MKPFFYLMPFLVPIVLMAFPGPDGKSDIHPSNIRAHVAFLADDLLEGRAPGSRGGELAAKYIATQLQLMGLEPGGDNAFYQMVPMVGMAADPKMHLHFAVGESEPITLQSPSEFVAWAGIERDKVFIQDRELVFVGYGIQAPEVPWNDYKQTDVRGKVLLMLVNDPPSEDPEFFGGKALTYYGRWTYKLEEAARQGAVGAILIHNTEMAGYPWTVVESSWTGEQFNLPLESEKSTLVEAWIQQDVADRLLKPSGLDFESLRQMAGRSDFKPIPLGVRVSIDIQSKVRQIESPNVIGRLNGSDPGLKDEVILVTTHYDHLGIGPEVEGDSIYNGAFDNASGTAALIELARALAVHRKQPRRSILFAAVTAEEQGLLGSKYYASHPLVPLSKTAANINLDGVNVWGKTRNIVALGAERSTIDETVRKVADEMNLRISPDPFPEKGYFFRSDQFSLVKVGVPAVYFDFGLEFEGQPAGWGEELMNNYTARHYHQPSDEFDPTWSFEGAAQQTEIALRTALYLANQDELPRWKSGDPFEEIRNQSLSGRR